MSYLKKTSEGGTHDGQSGINPKRLIRDEIGRKRGVTFDTNNNSVKVNMVDKAKHNKRKVQPSLLHLHEKRGKLNVDTSSPNNTQLVNQTAGIQLRKCSRRRPLTRVRRQAKPNNQTIERSYCVQNLKRLPPGY